MHAYDESLLAFEGNQIAYRKFGNGSAIWLAFHGFGQTGQAYASVEEHLGHYVTLYAIDLFFHGNSRYVSDEPFSKTNWNRLIQAFLTEKRIEHFSVMGFSLGGRFALATIETFANRLDQLILIAPDGIELNVWYELATRSVLGRSIFRFMLKHLPILQGLGHVLVRLGVLNRTVMRFVETSLNTVYKREQVYKSWTQFRYVRSSPKVVSAFLNNESIRIRFFVGTYDRIVPGKTILPLTKLLYHYNVTVFKTGHKQLIDKTIEKLAEELKIASL